MVEKRLVTRSDLEPGAVVCVAHVNLQPEGAVTGLAGDSTGVKYEGATRAYIDPELLGMARAAYLEAAIDTTATDLVVAVELYDDTAGSVAASLQVTGPSPRARSDDILGALQAGHEYHVRYNVVQASGFATTFDALAARLVVVCGG